uniref:Uncharacterized protein n=1 Tax=Haemonchus contortus TaxID=6289 RepID=A0A7I4XYW6_HAECO
MLFWCAFIMNSFKLLSFNLRQYCLQCCSTAE